MVVSGCGWGARQHRMESARSADSKERRSACIAASNARLSPTAERRRTAAAPIWNNRSAALAGPKPCAPPTRCSIPPSTPNSHRSCRPSALLTSAEETRPYECDGLTMYRELPAAVALPENEAQLVEVLRRCHAAGVPVVARGAGTSLSGGALPHKRRRRRRDGEVPPHRLDRSGRVHGRRAARRAQPRDLGRGRARTASTTRPTRRRRSPARSAATSARTPAACTASSTG